ncbi:MAG: hypothetical protein MUP82_06170 [Candidatus Marinimicrobia bacterium]|nr:hypothetical protein [Candidatus Neomarinimicrobiota bacterium]
MSIKTICLTIPDHESLPDIIHSFSPEETYLMLKIGGSCLSEGRKVVAGLTQKEIYQKIRDESKDEIQDLERNILAEREVTKKMEERIRNMYEDKLDKLEKQLTAMGEQMRGYGIDNKEAILKEVDVIRGRYDLLIEQKDRQVDKLADNYEKMLIQTHKSTSHKGAEGEKTFCDYADTFKDFKGFEIIDKHTQGGEGDFHLHFEDFDVLADAKNYKKKVPNDQREKIKNDLLKNEHLHFAWLVSLNTSIEKFDKAPIMYEWINTTQCVVYINNLSSYEDPQKILRIVWFTCKELYKLIEDVNFDEAELTGLRERNFKVMDKVKNIRKTIREINTSLNTTRNLIQVMDDELRGILDSETTQLLASNISLFDDWWSQNIQTVSSENTVSSTDLWSKFKQENKLLITDMNITGDNFKQYIKAKVPLSSIVLRSKNANSAFDIKGIQMTEEENVIIAKDKIDLEFTEEAMKHKKMVVKKGRQTTANHE